VLLSSTFVVMELVCVLFLAVIGHLHGSPLDIQFSDVRYNKLTQLLVSDCKTNITEAINQALAGDFFLKKL
jgi:hypothetical protein